MLVDQSGGSERGQILDILLRVHRISWWIRYRVWERERNQRSHQGFYQVTERMELLWLEKGKTGRMGGGRRKLKNSILNMQILRLSDLYELTGQNKSWRWRIAASFSFNVLLINMELLLFLAHAGRWDSSTVQKVLSPKSGVAFWATDRAMIFQRWLSGPLTAVT